MKKKSNCPKGLFIPDYENFDLIDIGIQTFQDFMDSINLNEFQNNFLDLSVIQQNQLNDEDDDFNNSFRNEILGMEKEEEKYLNKKEEEYKINQEYSRKNNTSQICDENFYDHPRQECPDKKELEYSKIALDKECPTVRERNNETSDQLSELCQNFSIIDNMNQYANQKIYLKETKVLFCGKSPEEDEKEKKPKIYSLEDDEIKNKIDIPKNASNSKLSHKHSSNCQIHNDSEVNNDIQQKTGNSGQISINQYNLLLHNDTEIKINIPKELNDSKQKKNQKNSTFNGSTGDSTQNNNPNVSTINNYIYPFKIIHPKEEDLISKNMNISSENLFSNFKRKRKSITKEIKKSQESFTFKKSEDLEKSILRKFKQYLRYKKDNGIKEFKDILDKDRNFWDSFLKNSKPFEFKEGGKTKKFNSYGKDLMDFIFKRDDVDYLYKKFASDESYINYILKNKKNEDYKIAYKITLKNLNKKYNEKYKDEDLEL